MRQSQLWNKCAMRADSVHVRHAIVEVNVVIGVLVVHGELYGGTVFTAGGGFFLGTLLFVNVLQELPQDQ